MSVRILLLALAGVWGASAAEISPIVSFLAPAGRPDEAECRRLVKTVADAGFDQMLLYPATGLDYEYLGEDYFRMCGTFMDELERRGMKLWLYDEFNWPSGTARGRVPAENEACLYRELVAVTNAAGRMRWETVVSREINADNYCLDTSNFEPASVRRFMELTHHEYGRRFGERMGTLIRGIFTDEPGHCSSAWRLKLPEGAVLRVPWWTGMEDEYRAASGGRDFRADFERAFREGTLGQSDIFRIWTEIRSKRYRKTYFDPIRAWCEKVGIESTGHLLGEHDPPSCARINGLPLHTLQGLGKPGIDLVASDTGRGFEWITLAFAQAGARHRGKPGSVELFALGPSDLTFTVMRKLYWICALHGIDTFFQATYHHRAFRFDVKAAWAMFTSPTQPWFSEMPLLHETAKEAARWACKPSLRDIAVVYPERTIVARAFADEPCPDLRGLCAELTWNQFNYDLVEEDEATERAVVLDWDGAALFERRTGTRFGTDLAAAVKWLEARFPARPRVKDAEGRTRLGFITRAYGDGSAVAVDATTGEVIVASDGNLAPRARKSGVRRELAKTWEISLSGPSCRRTWFAKDGRAKVTLTAPLKGVKFALRRYPADKAFAVTMDGRPLAFPKPCVSVAYAFNELYVETEPMDLAAGEHVFELSGGTDGKMFLPVMWMVGDFAERAYGVLGPCPRKVGSGLLVSAGLGSFAGRATYRVTAKFAAGERLEVDSGDAVVRVRLGERDLGACGWAPFAWEIPADLAGKELPLEIEVVTSVRPIFGDPDAPDAKLDHSLWIGTTLVNPPPAGLRGAFAVARDATRSASAAR